MKVLVIGGGAAGMMAAIAAGSAGAETVLLEKNEKLGKKLYITGKGRCNVTNACSREDFFTHLYVNERFMYSSFSSFGNFDMMDLMENAGVPLKIERGERVFPLSDRSSDILKGLERLLQQSSVTVMLHTEVKELLIRDGCCRGVLAVRGGKNLRLEADSVIVATGGKSYPATGSTGDGYRFAEAAGHHVTRLCQGLVPLEASWEDGRSPKELMGLSLKNVSVRFEQGDACICSQFGEMLFTHFGVSGPIVLTASGYLSDAMQPEKQQKKQPVRMYIDLKPALTLEQLTDRFLREMEGCGSRLLATQLCGWLPKALILEVLRAAAIPADRKSAEVTKREREKLLMTVKGLPMLVKGFRGFEEAIVTRGGVDVREIHPRKMASSKTENLYFAGEVLDLDASTGGFNLQIAWSTGHAAGLAAAQSQKEESV